MAEDKIQRAERTKVSLSAKLRLGEVDYACAMQNLSVGGAKIITDKPFNKGDVVQLAIGDFAPINANVAWARPPMFGLKFESGAQEEVAEILMSVATYAGGVRPAGR